MKDALEKLKEFHRVFNCARQDSPGRIDDATTGLRIELMREELEETRNAMLDLPFADETEYAAVMASIADGLADLCYVTIGTAVAYGIPLDKVFDEVHRSNMAKAPRGVVLYREDGKVLKPDDWTPPDVKGVMGL